MSSNDTVKLIIDQTTIDLPVTVGTEGERAIDISSLRAKTGFITIDPAYMNTGACSSAITFIDGDKGVLRYRGIPIDVLAEASTFLETAYLLIFGRLPTRPELEKFDDDIRRERELDAGTASMLNGFSRDAHPMAMLGSLVFALSAQFGNDGGEPRQTLYMNSIKLMAKVPTIIGNCFRYHKNLKPIAPRSDLGYCENFLYLLNEDPHPAPELVRALDILLILHADHEQNCSTSAVRMARSSRANIVSCISAGISALWGKRHGGANQEVIEMLHAIQADGGDVEKFVEKVKDKTTKTLLMGFGHRVYKNYDPRAKIVKRACDALLKKLKLNDPLLEIAGQLEIIALSDPYFIERRLYPNVDFYSGLVYKALGISDAFFTPMFALGRLPGWLAHAREFSEDPTNKIARPRQVYVGAPISEYTPIDKRSS